MKYLVLPEEDPGLARKINLALKDLKSPDRGDTISKYVFPVFVHPDTGQEAIQFSPSFKIPFRTHKKDGSLNKKAEKGVLALIDHRFKNEPESKKRQIKKYIEDTDSDDLEAILMQTDMPKGWEILIYEDMLAKGWFKSHSNGKEISTKKNR